MQVLSLTNDQINALPVGEREAIIALVSGSFVSLDMVTKLPRRGTNSGQAPDSGSDSMGFLVAYHPVMCLFSLLNPIRTLSSTKVTEVHE